MKCKWVKQDWQSYIHNKLNENEQNFLEHHLTSCSTCMSAYEEALTESFSVLEQTYGPAPDLSDQIMATILASEKPVSSPDRQRKQQIEHVRLTKTALFHYGIAASIAFLLYQVGFFDHIFSYAERSQELTNQSTQWFENARLSTEQWLSKLNELFRKSF